MLVFLTGRKVILRPPEKKTDLETVFQWINDPEIRQYVRASFPTTREEEESWFDGMVNKKGSDVVLAIETLDGVLIGTMGLHGINWVDQTATTGAIIGRPDYQSKGYGTDAKMTLLKYAFEALNLRKICSSVIAFNGRSLRYMEKCGYRVEGKRKKQIFKGDRYYDEILLAIFKEWWPSVWEKYERSFENKD